MCLFAIVTAIEFCSFAFQVADKEEKQEEEKEAGVDEQGGLSQSRRVSTFALSTAFVGILSLRLEGSFSCLTLIEYSNWW